MASTFTEGGGGGRGYVFFQVKQWIDEADNMEAKDWGQSIEHNMCVPIRSSLPPAPDELLKTILGINYSSESESWSSHADMVLHVFPRHSVQATEHSTPCFLQLQRYESRCLMLIFE
jgi:hypothetical protein